MRSPESLVARSLAVELILTLSILVACSDTSTSPVAVVNTGTPKEVEVAYCAGAPQWAAFQDGDGAWTEAVPSISGQHSLYRHTFMTSRAGFATAQVFRGGLTSLNVQYASPEELGSLGDTVPSHCGPAVSKTLLGTVAGLDANALAIISADPLATAFVQPNASQSFSLRGLPTGPVDVLAVRAALGAAGDSAMSMILRRNPELPDSATMPVLDFHSAEAFAPALASVALRGGGAEGISARSGLRTSHVEGLRTFATRPTGDSRTYYAIPESQLAAGDLQFLFATSNPTADNILRSVMVFFRAPVDQTLTLGAVPVAPTFNTAAVSPSLRVRVTFTAQADYDRAASVTFQQLQNTLVSVGVTAAYANLTGSAFSFSVPDLSAVSGFDSRWALQPGLGLLWTASRFGGTLGVGQNVVPTNGSRQRSAVSSGTFTP